MNLMRFNFDGTKKEALVINEPIDSIVLFDLINISFYGKNNYPLGQDCFNYLIRRIKAFFKRALENKLKLHLSLSDKAESSLLGYQWCKYLKKNDRKDLVCGKESEGVGWVGYRHALFESSSEFRPSTWLYNDEHGNIIFELTPVYPWFDSKPESGETFIKYSEWMKNYQPILTRTISKETAQQWIKQIDELIKVVKKNDKRLRCTGPGCKHCLKIGKTGCYCGS